jgi:hypothetical protein
MTYSARVVDASKMARILVTSAERAGVDGAGAVARLVEFLAVPGNEALAVAHVHDLWSARMFAAGFRYGQRFEPAAMRHPMLKPLERFTPRELRFELALVAGDLRALRTLLGPASPGELTCGAVARGIASLVRDEGFLAQAARAVHANRQRVRWSFLCDAGQEHEARDDRAIARVRVDLEALPLTMAALDDERVAS